MIVLQALRIQQLGKTLYVTALGLDEIKYLRENHLLDIDSFDPELPRQRQGYQRKPNPDKIQQIAKFVSRSLDEPGAEVLLPLMPTAVVLGCRPRDGSLLRYDTETSELTITDRAMLYVVDGQHRIEGIRSSTLHERFELPTVIVEDLDVIQEAAQFLTINSKQTKVRPDLQLRVLYNFDHENTSQLVRILRIDHWKYEAQMLAIALNDSLESPWRSLMRRPNEVTTGWRPMREAAFIDTLKPISDQSGPLGRIDPEKKRVFLIDFWEAIRQLYPEAFRSDTGRRYHICRAIGVGIFHALAPVIFHLRALQPRRSLDTMLMPTVRKAPLREWARRTGRFSAIAARRAQFVSNAADFSKAVDSRLDLVDRRALSRIRRRRLAKADENILDKAERLLGPLGLRRFDNNRRQETGQGGCYCLVRLRGQSGEAYIGKAENIGARLGQHDGYDLYNCQTAASGRARDIFEMGLYHLLRPQIRTNENHPSPQEGCPYC